MSTQSNANKLVQGAPRVKTPTVLQMEAVECGAAALAIILGYYGKFVPLEQLRVECGVSRDGSKALNIVKAARKYHLSPKAYKKEPAELRLLRGPMIIHWNFNHFLVLEGFKKGKVYLNDPACGPRVVSEEEFDQSYTGVVITFEPANEFEKSKDDRSLFQSLSKRLKGSNSGLAYIVIAGLLLVVPGLVIPTLTRIYIDNILLGGMTHWLMPLILGMGITALLRAVITYLQQLYLLRLESKLALQMSGQFLWHLLRLPISFFQQRYAGEIASRVAINDRVAQLLSGQLAIAMLDLMMVVFYFILMLQYNWVLTMVGLVIAFLNLGVLQYVSRRRTDLMQNLLQDEGKMQGVAMGGLQMIETLKASGEESHFFAKWAGWQSKLLNARQQMGIYGQYLTAAPTFLTSLSTSIIIIVGGFYILSGDFTIGMLVAFQSLMASFLGPVNRIIGLGATLQEVKGSMNRIDDVYRYPVDENTTNYGAEREGMPSKLSGRVELVDVTFGYSPLEPPLIENFNLQLSPGSRVALIGGSGSGKSTVARLIAGLYEPWSGEILFDHKPRLQIPRPMITNSVAVVDQDIHMFEGSIRDNVTLWDETVFEEEIIQACKDAYIHNEISGGPNGYDGYVQEGGRNFSGGQLQRLEIARALVIQPTILILDEATSALDAKSEQIVNENLQRRGCTCITVAHRLSTIRDADEIIVLDKGKVVERGVHDELKHRDGPYARLIAAY